METVNLMLYLSRILHFVFYRDIPTVIWKIICCAIFVNFFGQENISNAAEKTNPSLQYRLYDQKNANNTSKNLNNDIYQNDIAEPLFEEPYYPNNNANINLQNESIIQNRNYANRSRSISQFNYDNDTDLPDFVDMDDNFSSISENQITKTDTIKPTLYASTARTIPNSRSMRCNSNEHCYRAWYCVGGTANNLNTNLTGYCEPNMALKQLCNYQKIFTGKISRIILIYAMLTMAFRMISTLSVSSIKPSEVFAFCVAAFFILAPYQWLSLLSNDSRPVCDFVPTVTIFTRLRP